jgi:hypothetical protein
MARLFAVLTLLAVCACDQQSAYSPYAPYAPYQQNSYPYQETSGWQRNRPQASPYAGGSRQQQSPTTSPQAQRWSYPDGSVRWGVYDPNTGTMK